MRKLGGKVATVVVSLLYPCIFPQPFCTCSALATYAPQTQSDSCRDSLTLLSTFLDLLQTPMCFPDPHGALKHPTQFTWHFSCISLHHGAPCLPLWHFSHTLLHSSQSVDHLLHITVLHCTPSSACTMFLIKTHCILTHLSQFLCSTSCTLPFSLAHPP